MNQLPLFPISLNPVLLESLLAQNHPDQKISVNQIQRLELDNSSSILVTLTAAGGDQRIGHFRYLIQYAVDDKPKQIDVVIKIKPHGMNIAAMLEGLAQANGFELGSAYAEFSGQTGFSHSHEKELYLDEHFSDAAIFPKIYGTHADEQEELYYIMMEYLGDHELMNSVMESENWTDEHIRGALDAAAHWHAQGMDLLANDNTKRWPDEWIKQRRTLTPLYAALWKNAFQKLPDLISESDYRNLIESLEQVAEMQEFLENQPLALIHNDMNPRNSCFVRKEGTLQFMLYDWELCSVHVPYYDVVEFLAFVLDENRYSLRSEYFEYYRKQLETHSRIELPQEPFLKSIHVLHYDFLYLRIGMYLMAHCLSPYPFLPRVVKSALNGLSVKH